MGAQPVVEEKRGGLEATSVATPIQNTASQSFVGGCVKIQHHFRIDSLCALRRRA